MISPIDDPFEQEVVLGQLGDKVLGAVASAVAETRQDLGQYRAEHPNWVASSSERGLANWINDRLWDNLVRLLDDIEEVVFREQGPTREMIVSDRFRIRVKRHDRNGAIATYPTQAALFFYQQSGQLVLFDGLEEVRLVAGYTWEPEAREVGAPVLSLRDGVGNVIWVHELPEPPAKPATGIPPVSDAPAPTVAVRDDTGLRSTTGS